MSSMAANSPRRNHRQSAPDYIVVMVTTAMPPHKNWLTLRNNAKTVCGRSRNRPAAVDELSARRPSDALFGKFHNVAKRRQRPPRLDDSVVVSVRGMSSDEEIVADAGAEVPPPAVVMNRGSEPRTRRARDGAPQRRSLSSIGSLSVPRPNALPSLSHCDWMNSNCSNSLKQTKSTPRSTPSSGAIRHRPKGRSRLMRR